jgi:hypothetical protein
MDLILASKKCDGGKLCRKPRSAPTDYLLDRLLDGCIRVKTCSLRLGGVVAAKPLLILKQISFPANGGLLPDIRHFEI